MNRTGIFLAAAAVLALVALVAGFPRTGAVQTTVTTGPVVEPPLANGSGSLTMTARVSHPYLSPGRSDLFLTVDLHGADVKGEGRVPVNLALVIDRSGSMSGFKLNQAKQAARQLVSQLGSSDRLTIVHYGSDVKSMDGLLATEENKEVMLKYIESIWDDGGTNIGDALSVGRDLLLKSKSDFKVNRLILVSDGQPTEGLTDADGLLAIVREMRGVGLSVSSIGVGDDFNEVLMESFAQAGSGAYGYLQDAAQLSAIFQRDLSAAGRQVARNVTVSFRVPQGARLESVLGMKPLARTFSGSTEVITVGMSDFAAGQSERVVAHFVVDASTAGQAVDVSTVALDYTDLLADRGVKTESRLSALVTDQPELVLKNRDKDAIVFAARARSAVNMQAATEALKGGDRAKAEQLMQQNAFYFEEAAQVAGAPSVAKDVAEQKELLDGLKNAQGEGGINTYSKDTRKKARVNFGLGDSTY